MLESLGYIIVGIILATPLLLLNVRLAPSLGLIDWPKARGMAEEQIPLVGHSLVLFSLVAIGVAMFFFEISPWFLTTACVMALMGHFDDRKPLPALDKMFFQIVCVAAIVLFDPNIHEAMTVKYGPWGTFWAIFFILGLVNAINFIDGIDGLAGIVIVVGAAGFLLLSQDYSQFPAYQAYAALVIGMMIPFLYLNVVKRKGFLGNVGSYFFSYMLAMMHLSLPIDSSNPVSRLSLSGLCFLIPIADAIVVCLSRVITVRSPFQADKGHLHHRLIQSSIALRYILLNFGVIELLALTMGVLLNANDGARNSFIPIFVCASQIGIAAILIVLVEKASKRRMQGYFLRLDTGEPIHFIKYRFRREDGHAITPVQLKRIEARVSAEIRVSDLCFSEAPDQLFVTLRELPESLVRFSSRLDPIFKAEKVQYIDIVDEGEFIKVSALPKAPSRKRA